MSGDTMPAPHDPVGQPELSGANLLEEDQTSGEKFHATHRNYQQRRASRVFSPSKEDFNQQSLPAEI